MRPKSATRHDLVDPNAAKAYIPAVRMGLWSSLLVLIGCKTAATVHPGDPLPAFRAMAHDGSTVTPETLRGRWGVLWFYPKADTPG